MKLREDFWIHTVVIAMRACLLLFALRYVGFERYQADVLALAVIVAMEIQ